VSAGTQPLHYCIQAAPAHAARSTQPGERRRAALSISKSAAVPRKCGVLVDRTSYSVLRYRFPVKRPANGTARDQLAAAAGQARVGADVSHGRIDHWLTVWQRVLRHRSFRRPVVDNAGHEAITGADVGA